MKEHVAEWMMMNELMKQKFTEQPLQFFEFLKRYGEEASQGIKCVSDINNKTLYNIKHLEYYDIITFRIFICELFFNAIYSFPLVSEYKIICTNNITESIIHFKHFDELDDQNEPCLIKVTTSFNSFALNKKDIIEIFLANRTKEPNFDVINSIVLCMNMGGHDPIVKTEYTINKLFVNKIFKKRN